MVVSWEGGNPGKQAWEAPADCLVRRQLGEWRRKTGVMCQSHRAHRCLLSLWCMTSLLLRFF